MVLRKPRLCRPMPKPMPGFNPGRASGDRFPLFNTSSPRTPTRSVVRRDSGPEGYPDTVAGAAPKGGPYRSRRRLAQLPRATLLMRTCESIYDNRYYELHSPPRRRHLATTPAAAMPSALPPPFFARCPRWEAEAMGALREDLLFSWSCGARPKERSPALAPGP